MQADADALALTLRADDIAEIKAASGGTPESALTDGLFVSERCYTIECHGEDGIRPCAMFGIARLDADTGVIWMLGSDDISRFRRPFIEKSKQTLAELCAGYKVVGNIVLETNRVHVNWLKWLGFEFGKRIEIDGNTFIHFHKELA